MVGSRCMAAVYFIAALLPFANSQTSVASGKLCFHMANAVGMVFSAPELPWNKWVLNGVRAHSERPNAHVNAPADAHGIIGEITCLSCSVTPVRRLCFAIFRLHFLKLDGRFLISKTDKVSKSRNFDHKASLRHFTATE